MNTKAVKSFGLALMLAAGVLAVLLALGTFSPQKAAAQDVGQVTVSPDEASGGAGTFLKVTFPVTTTSILPGEEIVITLAGFVLPASIDAGDVNIRTGSGDSLQQGSPAAITIDGKKGTITLQLSKDLELFGDVASSPSVTFLRAAGIKAPLHADSDRETTAKENYEVNVSYGTEDGMAAPFTVNRFASPAPKTGDSDTDLVISGSGFNNGTARIYVSSDSTDAALTTITDVEDIADRPLKRTTVTDGAFSTTIDVSKNLGTAANQFRNGANYVYVVDPNNTFVHSVLTFTLSGKVKITGGNKLVRGTESVEIKLSEAPATVADTLVCAASVTIGKTIINTLTGERDVEHDGTEGINSDNETCEDGNVGIGLDGRATFTFAVPSGTAAGADQDLKVTSNLDAPLGAAKVEITSIPLAVTPDTAVQGRRVTLTGSGFKKGSEAATLTVTTGLENNPDTENVDESAVEVSFTGAAAASDGRLLVTFTVPDLAPGDQTVTVTQEGGRVGTGTLTVPEPTITIDPRQRQAGQRSHH